MRSLFLATMLVTGIVGTGMGIGFAATKVNTPTTRTSVSTVVLADTSSFKVRSDTLRFVVYDTLKITKTIRDTSITIKIDTVKVSSKPVQVVK